jgi:hypothetical protein
MAANYRIELVRATPAGWNVRTVKSGVHRVRVAFPPGKREKGSGVVVEILHPRVENHCKNPAELVLIGGNPMKPATAYDSLSRSEKLAFGRLGLGKKHLQTKSDIDRARVQVNQVNRLRNRLPNPLAGVVVTAGARELAAEFKHAPSEKYSVMNEPHVPAGDYARLGEFVAISIKPDRGGQVQEIAFAVSGLVLISNAAGRQLYIVGGKQMLTIQEVELFTVVTRDNPVLLGEARSIVYRATKWHPQLADSYRGKSLTYEHKFGEDGGRKPDVYYAWESERLLIRGGDYTVENVGIKN